MSRSGLRRRGSLDCVHDGLCDPAGDLAVAYCIGVARLPELCAVSILTMLPVILSRVVRVPACGRRCYPGRRRTRSADMEGNHPHVAAAHEVLNERGEIQRRKRLGRLRRLDVRRADHDIEGMGKRAGSGRRGGYGRPATENPELGQGRRGREALVGAGAEGTGRRGRERRSAKYVRIAKQRELTPRT